MSQLIERKHNHHVIPKLYLKGFVEDEKKPFIWVYDKNKPYKPGSKRHHNPQKLPISKAGVQRDHYAYKMRDGSIDSDKYENELEKLEKPSNIIFTKLRRHQMITELEKEVFAKYIFHMFKRVSKRLERFDEKWPDIYNSTSSEILNWLHFEKSKISDDDLVQVTKIKDLQNKAKHVLDFYKRNFLDSEIPLIAMAMESPLGIPRLLSAMTWQFYVAPTGKEFITGDNPVFNPGLDKWFTEISFPISRDVALVMSWYKIEEGFFTATPELVTEINKRTSGNAQKELYSSSAEKWIDDLCKDKREGYYLVYPYAASMFT